MLNSISASEMPTLKTTNQTRPGYFLNERE